MTDATTESDGDAPEEGAGTSSGRLGDEMRLLLDALAQRAEPWLHRLAAADKQAEHTSAICCWCPLCAGLAMLRGERPELAARAAEHAAELLAVLRGVFAEPHYPAGPAMPTDVTDQTGSPDQSDASTEPSEPRVQRIQVRRTQNGDTDVDGYSERDRGC